MDDEQKTKRQLIEELVRLRERNNLLERELADARGPLDAVMEHAPEGITIADAPDVTIRMVSKHGRELVERSRDNIEGISVERHVEVWDVFRSDGVTRATDEELPLTRATVDGEVVVGEEWVLGKPDGSKITILCNAGPVRDCHGCITGGIIAWRDITDRKRAEEALIESEEHFRAFVTASSDVVYRMSPDWSEMRQLRGKEFIPDTESPSDAWLERYIHPDDQPYVLSVINEAILNRSIFELQHRVLRVDGTLGWTYSRAIPLLDANGKIVEWFGAAKDVTAQKGAEARLEADIAALTRLHELSGRVLEMEGLQPLLQEIMNAAVMIVNADMGTLQLLEGDSLRIVAAHGHRAPFLEFFASAEGKASVCGEATRSGGRVIVSDVETGPLFTGTPSLEVLRDAGVRAVQSSPIISRNGALLGILTTQWADSYTPDEHDLWRIDLLARQAADLIEHTKAEEELRKSRADLQLRVRELKEKSESLEEVNTALKVLLKQREEDKKDLGESVLANVRNLITPYVDKLKKSRLSSTQKIFVEILESHVNEITSSFSRTLGLKHANLTPTEIRIAAFIRDGKPTDEIAEILCISEHTVSRHRDNIREKLGLRGSRTNLRAYLLSLA